MSKYLDFIGQQISQSKSAQGSQNEDLELSEETGIVAQAKKHGLKVAGGVAVIAGSFFAYKHFTKKDDEVLIDQSLSLEVESTPTKIHDFVDKEDAEKEGRGEEFEEYMSVMEEETPSFDELMAEFDQQSAIETPPMDKAEEMISQIAEQQMKPSESTSLSATQKNDSLEEIFGVQFSPDKEEEKDEDAEGSAAMNLPGADLFSGASLNSSSMIPQVEGKFQG